MPNPGSSARPGFVEPTRAIPLRWGRYDERYVAGLAFVLAGLTLILATNTYTIVFLLVGTIAHIGGWVLLPARGGRRLGAMFPSLLASFVLLVGPQVLWILVVPLAGWLLVRERPLRSWVVLLLPIAAGVAESFSFHTNHDEPLAFGIAAAVTVGAAWLARLLAVTATRA